MLASIGFTQDTLQTLPVGIAWILVDVIHRCRECPREDWSVSEYDLLVREDLSSQVKYTTNGHKYVSISGNLNPLCWSEIKTSETFDGMEDMDEEVKKKKI